MNTNKSNIKCRWCGVDLAGAMKVVYLNGNFPVCDLCLIKARNKTKDDYSKVSFIDFNKK